MQTRLSSLTEACLSTATGFLVSLLTQHFLVAPGWGLRLSFWDNFWIVALFTVISVARQYAWRRYFNWKLHAKR